MLLNILSTDLFAVDLLDNGKVLVVIDLLPLLLPRLLGGSMVAFNQTAAFSQLFHLINHDLHDIDMLRNILEN